MKTQLILAVSLIATAMTTGAAMAEEHEVQMLNRGPNGDMMVFEPAYLEIEPGDTVTFLPTEPSHNAESILNMVPEGGETFKGRVNQEISVTYTTEGVYGVKCLPHYGLGMVALIKVGGGEAPNLGEAAGVRHPGRANQRFHELFELVEAGAE
ncbi:pseudoazurin [Marinicauda pacifica]|uniref:Pseudoazurin n=1 Tax=Marinicauda pacifica TaxID=1133559 RepID=A0A4S2H8S4_9PROT|nr:pseudoazurin [Marinicauda pacifica]TGY92245.1 pseudoazurin [Marinicauda pacifica]GGE47244.1 pseudoazurin [Marinicauda pacifica]